MPEAKLCREADIRYVSIGMVTDYDCWHDNFLNVEVNNVLDTLKDNTQQSKEMIKVFLREYSNEQIEDELDVYKSIVTPVDSIKQETIIKLKNIVPSLYKDVIEKGKT
jgi:5'-methylthioadenosine phosphorylase